MLNMHCVICASMYFCNRLHDLLNFFWENNIHDYSVRIYNKKCIIVFQQWIHDLRWDCVD